MATVNELINAETQLPEENIHHTSWFGKLIERIQELDTEFPLSGGEDGHVHYVKPRHHAPVVKEPVKKAEPVVIPKPEPVVVAKEEKAPEHHHTSWFSRIIEKIQDLDSDFPLSGGAPSHHH